jgi:methylmalonyl-CoA mutase cobalamin-binding subunit
MRNSDGRPMEESGLDSAPAAGHSPLRFVTAASLFDGHDAAINMIRRLLQAQGAEVVHLGHNRSVSDIVRAAIEEDADGIAVSSYQGGHNEYFAYMVDMCASRAASTYAWWWVAAEPSRRRRLRHSKPMGSRRSTRPRTAGGSDSWA